MTCQLSSNNVRIFRPGRDDYNDVKLNCPQGTVICCNKNFHGCNMEILLFVQNDIVKINKLILDKDYFCSL